MTWRSAVPWVLLALVVLIVVAWFAGAFESPAPTPVTTEEEVVEPPPSESGAE